VIEIIIQVRFLYGLPGEKERARLPGVEVLAFCFFNGFGILDNVRPGKKPYRYYAFNDKK